MSVKDIPIVLTWTLPGCLAGTLTTFVDMGAVSILMIEQRVSLVFAIQTWLAETPESRKNAQAPGYFSVLMSGTQRPIVL